MIRIFQTFNGYGYEVSNGIIKVRQEYFPVLQGKISMTKNQAKFLAEIVMKKLQKNPLSLPTLTFDEVIYVWRNIK